jgi:hypothetical protein
MLEFRLSPAILPLEESNCTRCRLARLPGFEDHDGQTAQAEA